MDWVIVKGKRPDARPLSRVVTVTQTLCIQSYFRCVVVSTNRSSQRRDCWRKLLLCRGSEKGGLASFGAFIFFLLLSGTAGLFLGMGFALFQSDLEP